MTAVLAVPLLLTSTLGSISGKVTAEGGVAAPTVVYLEKFPGSKATPREAKAKIVQKNTTFDPAGVVVRAGESVEFPNADKIYHNVFSLTDGAEFDLGLYRGGVSKSVPLSQPGEIEVYCNIHPEMEARVLVVPNDHHVEVAADGSYTLTGVPAGTYDIVAWSPTHEAVRRKVTVKDGEARADFSLARRTRRAHMNKNGEQYGRYK